VNLSRQANGGDPTPDITGQYLEASLEYIKAANGYPPDDENRACKSPTLWEKN